MSISILLYQDLTEYNALGMERFSLMQVEHTVKKEYNVTRRKNIASVTTNQSFAVLAFYFS